MQKRKRRKKDRAENLGTLDVEGGPKGLLRRVRGRKLLVSLSLALLTLAVFWQVGHHEFINLDDPSYVSNNPHVQAGLTLQGLIWAFTTIHAANWHPLTGVSHMLDVTLC